MGVDKIVLRAILSTLAAVALLFVFMISALVFIYPATMMEITYDLGMDSASIDFAETAYERSDEVYYIAYATEVAIGIDDYASIEACGERFIADEHFTEFCANKQMPDGVTMEYSQYIYGQVCVSKYILGDKTGAINRSVELVGASFPQNNAMVAVLVNAMAAGDTASKNAIVAQMQTMQANQDELGLSATDQAYLSNVLTMATK